MQVTIFQLMLAAVATFQFSGLAIKINEEGMDAKREGLQAWAFCTYLLDTTTRRYSLRCVSFKVNWPKLETIN